MIEPDQPTSMTLHPDSTIPIESRDISAPGRAKRAWYTRDVAILRLGQVRGEAAVASWFEAEGLRPSAWANASRVRYARHAHEYDKLLACLRGSIQFITELETVDLGPGDRVILDAGTAHSAIVGPDGVECWEAARPTRP